MSTRTYAQQLVVERQAKLDAMMVDRNGKKLVIGDVVHYKRDARGSKFLWMGQVMGGWRYHMDRFYIMVSDAGSPKGYRLKYPQNIRKANRKHVVLFKLENL